MKDVTKEDSDKKSDVKDDTVRLKGESNEKTEMETQMQKIQDGSS